MNALERDILNIKTTLVHVMGVLENKRLMSPAEQTQAIEDVVSLVGADGVQKEDKDKLLKGDIEYDTIVAKLKKEGRIST
jgi:hypothetical protein